MRKFLSFLFLLTLFLQSSAQKTAKWDLRRCVEYAMANNISVLQADIQARTSEIILKQSKYSKYPSLNYNMSHGWTFGRSLNQNTNVYQNLNSMFENHSLQAQVTIFNWNSLNNTVSSNKYGYEADMAAVDKAKNDIGLNVARQYLLALLSFEQSKVNEIQLQQSLQQYNNTRKLVDAGTLPELNAVELEAQVARDSATLIQSLANYEIDKLSLKGLLNLPADELFELDTPPIETIPVDNILLENPADVYKMALNSQPQIKGNNLRLMASEKAYEASRGRLYPTISAFGGLRSSFNNGFEEFYRAGSSEKMTGTYTKSPTNPTPVYAFTDDFATRQNKMLGSIWNGYGSQLKDNFGQNFGLALSVPIFNGWQARSNVERSKLDIERSKLAITRDTLQLKQDVYNAYQQSYGSYKTFLAREKQVKTAERSFELASRRYDLGVMQTIEWLTIQNNLTRAKVDRLIAQYDYVFKMKVLEFYKGRGVRL
ncbi:MAG TPA: TolC family protein [Chitinophagaceae bacterium]|nr:TolC family protein [Chitinophagaceae bacterium]